MVNVSIPTHFALATIDRLSPDLAAAIRAETGSILFSGPKGTGKTFAMAAAARFWYPKGRTVGGDTYNLPHLFAWESDALLWDRVRAAWTDRTAAGADDLICELRRKKLVCLDDIGKGFEAAPKPYTEWLYALIDSLYAADVRVFLTTNLGYKELSAMSALVADRLVEMCKIIRFEGESRRVSRKEKLTVLGAGVAELVRGKRGAQ